MKVTPPVVGNWYRDLANDVRFEVVAIDEDSQTVGIQHFEGEVAELDLETWRDLKLVSMPPPEDWSGPFDDLDADDIGSDGPAGGHDWRNPLDEVK